jgi:tellurite resistance protein TerC
MKALKQIKKVIIAAVGFVVLLAGIVLIVLPGPASLVIPAGLAILATEFVWARNLLDKIKSKMGRSTQSLDTE